MGFFGAVGACYGNMLNFSGRARRAEYWWFFLFQVLFGWTIPVGVYFLAPIDLPPLADVMNEAKMEAWLMAMTQDGSIQRFFGYVFAAQLFLIYLPSLAVTVRRLHDTNRSGWLIFVPILTPIAVGLFGGVLVMLSGGGAASAAIMIVMVIAPLAISIWFIVLLAWPGSYGNNRFGPDPIKGRKRPKPDHPAFAAPLDGSERDRLESARRAEIKDYYRKNVLPSIQKV
jgi:uncharacterized membrane protein YhaH (DUF805 family)